jgi:putative sterol carrier protein
MTEFDAETLRSMDADQFAGVVKAATAGQLAELMAGSHRKEILDTIFDRLPSRFRADRAGNTDAVIRWNITGPDGTDSYQVTIQGGTCTTAPASEADPKVTFELSGPDFLTVIAGGANPMMMFMSGKLKAKGDLGLAANVANLFDLPKG